MEWNSVCFCVYLGKTSVLISRKMSYSSVFLKKASMKFFPQTVFSTAFQKFVGNIKSFAILIKVRFNLFQSIWLSILNCSIDASYYTSYANISFSLDLFHFACTAHVLKKLSCFRPLEGLNVLHSGYLLFDLFRFISPLLLCNATISFTQQYTNVVFLFVFVFLFFYASLRSAWVFSEISSPACRFSPAICTI